MFNQKSEGSSSRGKVFAGAISSIAVFAMLELIFALLIHKEVVSIDLAPVLSYAAIFSAGICGAFIGTGDGSGLVSALLAGSMFLSALLVLGLAIFKSSLMPYRLLICALLMFAGIFGAVLIKTYAGMKYGRKKHKV